MKSSRLSPAATVALVAIVAVVVTLGLVGGRSTTSYIASHDFEATDHPVSEGVVISKTQRGGFAVMGVTVRQPEHYVRVAFTVLGQCDVSDVAEWPVADPECAGPTGLTGSIAGYGVSATGDPIVLVERQVVAECYDAVQLGAVWPLPASACWAPE